MGAHRGALDCACGVCVGVGAGVLDQPEPSITAADRLAMTPRNRVPRGALIRHTAMASNPFAKSKRPALGIEAKVQEVRKLIPHLEATDAEIESMLKASGHSVNGTVDACY